ncbi:hypothetical protein DCAR_0414638 [Daucus carota subsp. sativus]|uniref:Uncharacterized protein n=1 Tax=Daucus carota subsp. sativus TaxID=79200 RepID=A0A175YDB0_DAUCS|nr:hypothetical protein DCAR_0414638 [Daucus carota subsp. sativus]
MMSFKTLQYKGEHTKIGSLQRALVKKQWNFFFDCISRCFLNKVSGFDALPSGSLQIPYSLIHDTPLNYGEFILAMLAVKKEDKTGYICYTHFLQLIFNHFYHDYTFENDELIPIFKIAELGIKTLINGDNKTGFNHQCVVPNMQPADKSPKKSARVNTDISSVPHKTATPVSESSPNLKDALQSEEENVADLLTKLKSQSQPQASTEDQMYTVE